MRLPSLNTALLAPGIASASLGARALATSSVWRKPTPLEQLQRVSRLQAEVSSTNSKTGKEHMLAQYPDLRELLEHVYDPKHRTHLSSASLKKYLDANPLKLPSRDGRSRDPESITGLASITELFDTLSSRKVTGNLAKDLVLAFMYEHDIRDEEALDVFYRLLDRNLMAGFGARTLMQVNWAEKARDHEPAMLRADQGVSSPVPEVSAPKLHGETATSATSGTQSAAKATSAPKRALKAFSCALGKTILPPFTPLFKSNTSWYASRKLDGVRCLTFLDFDTSTSPPRLVQVQHLSRTGKPFYTLGNLKPHLRLIEKYPGLSSLLDADPETVEHPDGGERCKRLVLDGEVCVMVPSTTAPAPPVSTRQGEASPVELWSETGLIEDFPATVSEIRRLRHDIGRPAYYLFDLLSYAEFENNAALHNVKGLGKSFSGRLEDLRGLCDWLSARLPPGDPPMLKALSQQVVHKDADVEGMVETAAAMGWEGLVLRANKAYVGKRSTDVRKFKQWQDAEYTVTGVDISRQRLAVDGTFGEHDAVAAVHIDHKGHQVAVGSGLTAEQRIRWAKDPKSIIGKQITAEYFSESEAQGRQGTMSLRFPRIKAVWDGKRDL